MSEGNRFITKDGHNGLLAKANVEDFSHKLLLMLQDSGLSNRLAQNALKTIKDNYDSKIVAKKFNLLIKTISTKI